MVTSSVLCYNQAMDEILANAIADQEKYDRVVKEIFDKPKIVATILRLTVPEFQGMTVEEVLPYILEISDEVPVDDISSAALRNQPQEQTALLGKIITYDKHIKARSPKAGELNITLYFDFEFQNEYRSTTLGYPLLKRGWFYAARELDSQLGVLTEDTKYSTLQKSYSIWICNEDIPKEEQNSMTRYHIVKDDVIGHSEDVPENYDLMEVIMIRRGDAEIDAEIFDFLNGIFKSETERVNKYTGNDPVIEEEVKKMGGFGAALAEKNRNEGIGIGRDQRDREKIEVMLRKGLKPEEVANYGDYPLTLVKEVEKNMLSLA